MGKVQERRKNKRKKWRMFRQAFRIAGADLILEAYLFYFLLAAFLIRFAEPSITNIFDSLWYCFSVATTVGFGDIAAMTVPGRIITVILSIYSIGVVTDNPAISQAMYSAIAANNLEEVQRIITSGKATEETPQTDAAGNPVTDGNVTIVN